MIKLYFLLVTLNFICGILASKNLISINEVSSIDTRYSLGKIDVVNKQTLPKVNKIFDINNIVSIFKNDIQAPKIFNNISISEIFSVDDENVSKECMDLIQLKYSCITLQNKDFDLFCQNINQAYCNLSNQIKFDIRDKCNVALEEVDGFVKTVDNIITTKKFFCVKQTNGTEYCPLTKSLQEGYLELVKITEKNEKEIAKKKRSPLISNVNSFIPSRSIDLQVIRRKLVEDLKKNCYDKVCHQKTREYINNIKQDYSYFNLIYQYQINDDTLKESLLNVLKQGECSNAFSKYIISYKIVLLLISIVILLLF